MRQHRGTSWARGVASFIALTALLGACGGTAGTAGLRCPVSDAMMICGTSSEADMERQIQRYLEAEGWKVVYREFGGDQGLILYVDETADKPAYRLAISSFDSTPRDAEGRAERAVAVELFTGLTIPEHLRSGVLRKINARTAGYWAGAFFVNPNDGELQARWILNLTKEFPLAIESVQDAVIRLMSQWREFAPELRDVEDPGTLGAL